MKISIITVCFNAEKTIAAAVGSVLAQKGADIEHIVVDGASTDSTLKEVLRVGGGRVRLVSEPDRGMYDALNKGIAMATGDIVGILNSDDEFDDEFAASDIASAFTPETDAVYADVRFAKDGVTTRYYSAAHWKPWMHNWGYMPPHPSVYIRRGLFGKLGGYKLGYRISADFELMVRYFCRARIRTAYLPRCVVKMRPGGLSTCGFRSKMTLNRENVRANRENGYFCCFAMMLPKYAYKALGCIFRR